MPVPRLATSRRDCSILALTEQHAEAAAELAIPAPVMAAVDGIAGDRVDRVCARPPRAVEGAGTAMRHAFLSGADWSAYAARRHAHSPGGETSQ